MFAYGYFPNTPFSICNACCAALFGAHSIQQGTASFQTGLGPYGLLLPAPLWPLHHMLALLTQPFAPSAGLVTAELCWKQNLSSSESCRQPEWEG